MIYLNREEFFGKYGALFSSLKSALTKVEVLQNYSQPDFGLETIDDLTPAQIEPLLKDVQKNVLKQKERFSNVLANGVTLSRIRYIKFPISKYILTELSTYQAVQAAGENIYIIDDAMAAKIPGILTNPLLKDFIIFDNVNALVHDNMNGYSIGANFIDSANELTPYIEFTKLLFSVAIPYGAYLKNFNLSFSLYDEG